MGAGTCRLAVAVSVILAGLCATASAAQLTDVRSVDEQYVMLHWLDGVAEYAGDSGGPDGVPKPGQQVHDVLKRFEPALDTAAAVQPASYFLASADDPAYAAPAHPLAVFRKSKVNGTDNTWPNPFFTLEHTVYLKLPHPLQQGKAYTVTISPQTNSDKPSATFTFDVFKSVSEAIHVNIIGYDPGQTAMKSADLYMWLGDGGARDYIAYAGRSIVLYNVDTGEKKEAGKVVPWKQEGKDFGGWDLTRSNVWNCDFSAFTGTGRYRLAIEGIGCSPDFTLSRDVYYEPLRNSVRGFFYMRMGMAPDTKVSPPPRQPQYMPGKDPAGFTVYRTTFGPWTPEWKQMRGDVWDRKDEWGRFDEPGKPTNPNAWGGHADAGDWDRHAGHISIIYDMLLPYFLSNGKIADDDLGIAESGNGIPDIIDEARYEVDLWLRLRDGKGGYCFGLNNPSQDNLRIYQAGACPYMAWANAANCAMMADCMRIAGKADLAKQYTDAALEAWRAADGKDLDFSYGVGNGTMRGRDLKMTAGAFLYDVTGDRAFEDAMAQESVVKGPDSVLDNPRSYCQYWGAAAYLVCAKNGRQPIHYPELLANMKAAILHEAMTKNVAPSEQRPSRRSSDEAYGWFQATEMVDPLCIAYAVSTDSAEQQTLLKAMLLEADYGLGRNTLNMVEMTGLGSRCVEDMFGPGQRDGVPGMDPGLTPYMNADAWGGGYMADPQWYAGKGYPSWDKWPHAEAHWNVRYCYSNGEFTPQQTMRGKTALLGFLYSLGETHKAQ